MLKGVGLSLLLNAIDVLVDEDEDFEDVEELGELGEIELDDNIDGVLAKSFTFGFFPFDLHSPGWSGPPSLPVELRFFFPLPPAFALAPESSSSESVFVTSNGRAMSSSGVRRISFSGRPVS